MTEEPLPWPGNEWQLLYEADTRDTWEKKAVGWSCLRVPSGVLLTDQMIEVRLKPGEDPPRDWRQNEIFNDPDWPLTNNGIESDAKWVKGARNRTDPTANPALDNFIFASTDYEAFNKWFLPIPSANGLDDAHTAWRSGVEQGRTHDIGELVDVPATFDAGGNMLTEPETYTSFHAQITVTGPLVGRIRRDFYERADSQAVIDSQPSNRRPGQTIHKFKWDGGGGSWIRLIACPMREGDPVNEPDWMRAR